MEEYSAYVDANTAREFVQKYGADCTFLMVEYYDCRASAGQCEMYEYDGYSYEVFGTDACESIYDEFYNNCYEYEGY